MNQPDMRDTARNIIFMGRSIHDLVQRTSTAACMSEGFKDRFGELSAPQMNMIMMIRFREKVSVTQLAALLNVSPPSASTMVERLVERKILTRTPNPKDRRKVDIQVTPQATEAIMRVEDRVIGVFAELVEALGPETTGMWCEVLQRIKAVLDKKQFAS